MIYTAFDWVVDRICEPSTWAAVGVGLIGIGIIQSISILIAAGIGVAGVAVILKEKSKK